MAKIVDREGAIHTVEVPRGTMRVYNWGGDAERYADRREFMACKEVQVIIYVEESRRLLRQEQIGRAMREQLQAAIEALE